MVYNYGITTIVDLLMKNRDFPVRYVSHYQRLVSVIMVNFFANSHHNRCWLAGDFPQKKTTDFPQAIKSAGDDLRDPKEILCDG